MKNYIILNRQLKIEDYREHYNLYFKEFNRLAVGEYADLSYGSDQPNGTASSLESIIAYANYILKQGKDNPKILNAGSGASSWMLRHLFGKLFIVDVEPNKRYSNLVAKVCEENERDFYNWFGLYKGYEFDHVYFDYGSIERLPYLGYAIEVADKSCYIDDTDCRDECMPYRNHVIELCKAMDLKWFDCLESKDDSGRWGIIIEK